MGITEDISERKMAEMELLEAKKNAEDANSLKDKFVSLVSHDLMAPLSGILGFLKMVRTESVEKLGEAPRKMVELAVSSGEHMASLIQDILSLSRLRTGSLKPTMEFFEASLIGEKMAADYQYAAYAKGVVLENLIPGRTRLYSDKTLLTESVQNFVTNAIKFCRKGDRVTLSVEKGDKTTVWVTDTGPGIEPSLLRKLVDHEGYRSKQGTGGEKGTGYGLMITREMLEALGGELLIESEPGKGSRFGARIPSVRPKILLVVADADFRGTIMRHLDAVDTDVLEADDGVSAVEKIAGGEGMPHLIISVMETSGIPGIGLLSHLQMRGVAKPIPVIIISEKSGTGRDAAVYGLMASEYLFKPLDVDDFIARVRLYVG
jgi:CheY-like chemotaxis protein